MAKSKKKAFITGVTGQDGSYLADLLIKKNYEVHGLLRRSSLIKTDRIDHLFNDKKIFNKSFYLHYGDMTDDLSLYNLINKIKPNEIYNLAAQSHVKVSFELPMYTANADALGTLRILEAVKSLRLKCKIYQASTSEIFGNSSNKKLNENSQFKPVSPYGIAKLYSFEIIKAYRNAYNIFACNGILFNHESPRRGETFVTKKITKGIVDYYINKKHFKLGNLDAFRDWGHAKEYVEAMWRMLQLKNPIDLVISTGKSYSVKDFLKETMKTLKIDYYEITKNNISSFYDKKNNKLICQTDKKFERPNEVNYLLGDSKLARKKINWNPKINFQKLVKEMVEFDLINAQKKK